MRLTPNAILERALQASILTDSEKEEIREAHSSALVFLIATEGVGYGGTDAEDDCPREPGSKTGSRMRPGAEGLTAGARWREGL